MGRLGIPSGGTQLHCGVLLDREEIQGPVRNTMDTIAIDGQDVEDEEYGTRNVINSNRRRRSQRRNGKDSYGRNRRLSPLMEVESTANDEVKNGV